MQNFEESGAILDSLPCEGNYAFEKAEVLYYCERLDESYAKFGERIDNDDDQKRAIMLMKNVEDLKLLLSHMNHCQLEDKCCLKVLAKLPKDSPTRVWKKFLMQRSIINKKVRTLTKINCTIAHTIC
jgi:hypothetical protein